MKIEAHNVDLDELRANTKNFRVYVAGPLNSSGRTSDNVHRACSVAKTLSENGLIPFVPHLYHFMDAMLGLDEDAALSLDFAWLSSCHFMLRLPGQSRGSEYERVFARKKMIPVGHAESHDPEDIAFELLEWYYGAKVFDAERPFVEHLLDAKEVADQEPQEKPSQPDPAPEPKKAQAPLPAIPENVRQFYEKAVPGSPTCRWDDGCDQVVAVSKSTGRLARYCVHHVGVYAVK